MGKAAFVTVGTTKFDALIEAVDDVRILDALAARGFDSLTVQKGAGAYVPCNIVPPGQAEANLRGGLFRTSIFDFAPSLAAHMQAAELVISHAGAGSLFEALGMGKAVVAVPNPILMDNHQIELAQHLEAMGHCLSATPDSLLDVLRRFDAAALVPYRPGSPSGIVAAIERFVGA